MAVTCPRCGEFAYAEGVCEHCGASLAPAAHVGEQDVLPWSGGAVDPAHARSPWAEASAEATPHATADLPAPQGRLRIRKLPQDPPTTHEGEQWEFAVDGKQISIGRAPSCDLTLESDLLVSRRHAIIFSRHGMHLVLDLGSSNGTWVNDSVITEETPLRVGDAIRIGEYELVYTTVSAVLEAPAAPLPEADSTVSASHEAAPMYAACADGGVGADVVAANHDQGAAPPPAELQGDSRESESSIIALGPPSHVFADAPAAQPFQARVPVPTPLDHNLESLQSQVVGLVTALRQKAEDDARYAGDLRDAMSDVQKTVAELISRYGAPPTEGLAFDELLRVVHQAAENPRHLDYVTSLAMNAGSIALALDAFQVLYAPYGLLDSLAKLKERLDQMLT